MGETVLVTAIGTVTATAIVKEIKKTGRFRIIGADINPRDQIATSLDVDEFYVFPSVFDAEEYLAFALDFCRTHDVRYYYAVLDKEVVNLARNRDRFQEVGTTLCVPDHEFAELCHYKDQFCQWIEENYPGIAIRSYPSLEEAERSSFPLFIKPVEGVASAGCRKLDSPEALRVAVSPFQAGREILIQDYVEGQLITVDCIRNRSTGQTMQVQRKELLRNANGCGIAVEIIQDEALADICIELMEQLDLHGVANMEFFDTGNGYRIIEINPRFSAGTSYTCMAGVNTVLNAMFIADGNECMFGEPEIGARFAERYEAYRMDEEVQR